MRHSTSKEMDMGVASVHLIVKLCAVMSVRAGFVVAKDAATYWMLMA